MHEALQNLSAWSNKWGIEIATNKSYVICIGKNNHKEQYKINEVDSIRDLGIIIDKRLRFEEHINKIIKNVYGRMRTLFRVIRSKKFQYE